MHPRTAPRPVVRLGLLVALALAACAPAPAGSQSAGSAPAAPPAAGQASPAATAPAAAAPSPPPREALRMPYPAISFSVLPHWITYQAGLYEREGLDVTMDYVAASAVLTSAMLSGEVKFAYAGPEAALSAGIQGGDMVVLSAGVDRPLFWISTQPSIRAPQELRGKRVGITRYGSPSDGVLRSYLPTIGLDADRDITLVQMGGVPESVVGLQSGALDAAVLSPPSVFQAKRNGANLLVDLGDLDFPLYQNSLISTRRFLSERPDVARRVARAFAAGWRLLGDEAVAVDALRTYSQLADDSLLVETYQAGRRRLPESPVPQTEAIAFGLRELAQRDPAAAQFTPEQFMLPDLMAQAWAEPPR
jgi:NitT/TauT family transport system substrate-binding protein